MVEQIIAIVLGRIILIFELVLIVNIILSWLVHSTPNMVVRQIYWWTGQLVNPVLDPIRRILRPYQGGIPFDFSPLILLIILSLASGIL